MWECDTSMASSRGNSLMEIAGACKRLGPIVTGPIVRPICVRSAGSVNSQVPYMLIRTVAWPSHATVRRSSRHLPVSGRNGAEGILRRDSRHCSPKNRFPCCCKKRDHIFSDVSDVDTFLRCCRKPNWCAEIHRAHLERINAARGFVYYRLHLEVTRFPLSLCRH